MKKFEHKVLLIRPGLIKSASKTEEIIVAALDEFGAEGWELVGCIPMGLGEYFVSTFKREIQE